MERRYREEKIKITGLTRKVNAIETEKKELKQEIDNATEFFNVLDGINDELKNNNERYIRYIENTHNTNSNLVMEIAEGEELFTVVEEMNDELNTENKDLQEMNDDLKTKNENLHDYISRMETDDQLAGKYSEGEMEEMEIATGDFFEKMDDMMNEKDKN